MNVLIACEFSGKVRDAFVKRGHFAVSVDLLPTAQPGFHYQGDVFDLDFTLYDLLIAHPPCTFLANSGVRWLYRDPARWAALDDAARFFQKLLNAPVGKIAVENPIMHKHGKARIGGAQQTQTVQPWWFGHPEQKATCLWLKNLPPLTPTNDVKHKMAALTSAERQRVFHLPPSADRWRLRSETFQGVADAMAEQWG